MTSQKLLIVWLFLIGLKREIRGFEAQFYSTHLRKPIAEEKKPIKHLLLEVAALRKQLKSEISIL